MCGKRAMPRSKECEHFLIMLERLALYLVADGRILRRCTARPKGDKYEQDIGKMLNAASVVRTLELIVGLHELSVGDEGAASTQPAALRIIGVIILGIGWIRRGWHH
jgi:hypothetical protein